jgi:hypothetical protein
MARFRHNRVHVSLVLFALLGLITLVFFALLGQDFLESLLVQFHGEGLYHFNRTKLSHFNEQRQGFVVVADAETNIHLIVEEREAALYGPPHAIDFLIDRRRMLNDFNATRADNQISVLEPRVFRFPKVEFDLRRPSAAFSSFRHSHAARLTHPASAGHNRMPYE